MSGEGDEGEEGVVKRGCFALLDALERGVTDG